MILYISFNHQEINKNDIYIQPTKVGIHFQLGNVCFLEEKIHENCGPPLQPSATEDVYLTAITCIMKHDCFFDIIDCCNKLNIK